MAVQINDVMLKLANIERDAGEALPAILQKIETVRNDPQWSENFRQTLMDLKTPPYAFSLFESPKSQRYWHQS
jgi:hypothetical protein